MNGFHAPSVHVLTGLRSVISGAVSGLFFLMLLTIMWPNLLLVSRPVCLLFSAISPRFLTWWKVFITLLFIVASSELQDHLHLSITSVIKNALMWFCPNTILLPVVTIVKKKLSYYTNSHNFQLYWEIFIIKTKNTLSSSSIPLSHGLEAQSWKLVIDCMWLLYVGIFCSSLLISALVNVLWFQFPIIRILALFGWRLNSQLILCVVSVTVSTKGKLP